MLGLADLTPGWEWRLLVSLIVAAAAFGGAYLVRRLRRRLVDRTNPILVDLLSSTLIVGIVVLTVLVIADLWGQTETLVEQMGFLRLGERAPELVVTLVVLIAVQVFAGIAARLLGDLTDNGTLTDHQREVSLRLVQITLWTTALLIVLGVWEIDLTGLLVGAGFLGIVVGLAARKTLGAMLAGFVLMLSRPFEVGDWIAVDDEEGIVSDITLMSTRIRAFDGEYIVVPNDVINSQLVRNRSRQGRLRAEVDVGVDFETDVDRARPVAQSAAEEVVSRHDRALETPEPSILAKRFGDSAIVLSVRVWVDEPTARAVNAVKDDLVCTVKDAFEAEDVDIPFPQRTLSARDDGLHFARGERSHSE